MVSSSQILDICERLSQDLKTECGQGRKRRIMGDIKILEPNHVEDGRALHEDPLHPLDKMW